MDKIDKIDALFVAKSTSVPGLGGGVKPILAMPGFWTLWLLQSLPKGRVQKPQARKLSVGGYPPPGASTDKIFPKS